jgi:hypothetical protein
VKRLAREVPTLKDKRITNKTGRNTGISRLEEALVPIDREMELTGHRDSKSYKKYNRDKQASVSAAAMQAVMTGDQDGNAISYVDALLIERSRQETLKINFILI